MRLQEKTKEAKKVIETFRVKVDKKLTPLQRRDVEDMILKYIKDGQV